MHVKVKPQLVANLGQRVFREDLVGGQVGRWAGGQVGQVGHQVELLSAPST